MSVLPVDTNERTRIETTCVSGQAVSKPTVIFVANRSFGLVRSRHMLVSHFLADGWQVVGAVTPDRYTDQLAEEGVIIESVFFNRKGLSPLQDGEALVTLIRLYRKYRPALVHHFHPKPIILGNLAALPLEGLKVVNSITGLGGEFVRSPIKRLLAVAGYRLSLPRSEATIFQNPDDRRLFVEKGWTPKEKARLIASSGVDLDKFYVSKRGGNGIPRVLMVSRLVWDKGVREFVKAAEIVKAEYPAVRFQLAGEWEKAHPDGVDREWLQRAEARGAIEFLGYVENMPDQLQETDLFVLPSSYPEGVPRVLLEAAACGVPIVTTDSPGCREAVIDGETGLLVPMSDSQALARALLSLLTDPGLRRRMGENGRQLVEERFDMQLITKQYLSIYREIGLDV